MGELPTIRSMRNRLMNYTKSIPGGKWLRQRFSQIGSVMELEDIFAAYLVHQAEHGHEHASNVEEPTLNAEH
jgi:hypothetical protein